MQKSSRKLWIWLIVSVLFLGAAGYVYSTGKSGSGSVLLASLEGETTPIHIALVVPEGAPDSYPEQENVGKLFERQVNEAGGVNGRPIQIDFYYDGKDSVDEAKAKAQEVVKDNQALVVIGHRNSAPSAEVAPLYEAAGMPTINAGAAAPEVTKDHPWAFRVINNTNDLGKYAALYARDVLGYTTASIVHEDDNFGTSLADSFKSTFENNGTGKIIYNEPLTRITEIGDAGLSVTKNIVHTMSQPNGEKPGIVFLGVSRLTAQEFVLALRQSKQDFPMIASYAMSGVQFANVFDDPSYVNGMYAMSLLNYDVAGEEAQNFYNDYTTLYKDSTPSWLGGTTYDALQVALEAIKATNATGDPKALKAERQKIKDYLASINNPNKAIDGVSGQIYFDAQRNFSQPPTFGVFQQGNFVPAPIQLRPAPNKNLITDLSNVIVDNNKYIYKTNVVYTGIKINEITDVDVDKAHVFTADFYLWFRYQGDLDVESIEFLNSVTPVKLDAPISASTRDNINYRLYRVRAQFHTTFDLQNYPFDTQELAIQFRHRNLTREKLIYVEDTLGMDQITRGVDLLARLNSDGVFAAVSDWSPANPKIYIDVHSNKASLGNPALIGSQQNIENSTFNMKVEIDRNYPRFALKNLLPLFCLVFLAYVSLFLPGYKFETIISIMTGSVLSIVFFHVNLSNRLSVGYSVALDYVFYGTYLLFILELMTVVFAWHYHQIDEKRTHKRMWFARLLYPAYTLLGGAFFLWLYTNPNATTVIELIKGTMSR